MPHTPHPPHTAISPRPPNTLNQSPPSPVGHGHDLDVAPITARPEGCAVMGRFYCCVLFASVDKDPCSRPSWCVPPHPRPCFAHPSCVMSRSSSYRHAQARTFAGPSGRWQPRVKGCRSAARVKFCEGPRTCPRGNTAPMHLENCRHIERRLSPGIRTHPDLQIRRIGFCWVMQEFCRIFRARFFP